MPGIKLTRKLPAWNGNVAAGNTVTLRLPLGLSIHRVWTVYSFADACCCAITLANAVNEIRVLANGKVIWNILASELDLQNQYEGRTAAGGIVAIDFDRFNLRTRIGEELTTLGSGNAQDPNPLTTLVIEMDLKAGVVSGTLDSRVINSEAQVLGLIKKVRRFTQAFGGAGEVEIADYPKGDRINMVSWFESANDIDRARLLVDNYEMFDRTKELNSRIQTDGVRVPQTNLFVYDTSEDGNGADQLLTRYPNGQRVNDLRFFLTLDGAMTVTSLIQYIGALES